MQLYRDICPLNRNPVITHKAFQNILHSLLKLESRLLEVEMTYIITYPIANIS